jgi:hypothetical protein
LRRSCTCHHRVEVMNVLSNITVSRELFISLIKYNSVDTQT